MKRQKHLLPAVDSKRWRNGCFAACRKSLGNAFLGVDGNGSGRNERNAAMNKIVMTAAVAALVFATFAQGIPQPKAVREADAPAGVRGRMQANPDAKLHRFSTIVEKERPQLNQETKDLISAYRRDPSDANRAALRVRLEAHRLPHRSPHRIAQGRRRLSQRHFPRHPRRQINRIISVVVRCHAIKIFSPLGLDK